MNAVTQFRGQTINADGECFQDERDSRRTDPVESLWVVRRFVVGKLELTRENFCGRTQYRPIAQRQIKVGRTQDGEGRANDV